MNFNHPFMQDSQTALEFLIPQLTHIEAGVYRTRYPNVRYPELVPVDTSANPWATSVTYFSMDMVGAAQWFNAAAQDVPEVGVNRNKYQTGIKMAAIGYSWDIEEMMQAQMLGIPLSADKANMARRGAEEFMDRVLLFGDTSAGFVGMLNSPAIPLRQSAATGTGGSTYFTDKTAAQNLTETNALLTSIYVGTNTVEIADTLVIPVPVMEYWATTPFNTFSETTILEYIRKSNVYTATTGRPLKIMGMWGFDSASPAGAGRMIAYRRSPEVIKFHLPMPFRFLGTNLRDAPLQYHVPGIFRLGGTDIRLPNAMCYLDGVCAPATIF